MGLPGFTGGGGEGVYFFLTVKSDDTPTIGGVTESSAIAGNVRMPPARIASSVVVLFIIIAVSGSKPWFTPR